MYAKVLVCKGIDMYCMDVKCGGGKRIEGADAGDKISSTLIDLTG